MNGQAPESKVQQLAGLLKKSARAYGKVHDADDRLYSYIHKIEKRLRNKMPHEPFITLVCDIWNSLDWEHDYEDLLPLPPEDQVPTEDIPEQVMLANPRLPVTFAAELGRRVQAASTRRREAHPTYDKTIAFLDLDWAFQYRQPGCAADPLDEKFLDTLGYGDPEPSAVIPGYEAPLETVDYSVASGPATTEEAEKLIALAQAVNAARAEYRAARQTAMVAVA